MKRLIAAVLLLAAPLACKPEDPSPPGVSHRDGGDPIAEHMPQADVQFFPWLYWWLIFRDPYRVQIYPSDPTTPMLYRPDRLAPRRYQMVVPSARDPIVIQAPPRQPVRIRPPAAVPRVTPRISSMPRMMPRVR